VTLDEMLEAIENSEASDWTYFTRPTFAQDIHQVSGGGHPVPWVEVQEHDMLLSFKPDLAISIVAGLPHRDDFFEDWARRYPDEKASSSWVDFRYNGVPVLRELRVIVDGGRAGLPCPRPGTLKIPERQFRIWRLIDEVVSLGQYDDYFRRADFEVTKEPWPHDRSW
jgi:hypothetical protein